MRSLRIVLVIFCVYPTSDTSTWNETIRVKRQSNSQTGICVLPPYPNNGRYSVVGSQNAKPGDEFTSIQINFSCFSGYQPLGNRTVLCVVGEWSADVPKCVRYCKLVPHPSVKYRCQVAVSTDSEESYYRECQDYEPAGTIVRPKCNGPNYYYTGLLSNMNCIKGRWNYIAICIPQCGTVTPGGKPLIVGGRQVERGEFPWHTGIYRKDVSPYKLICGGSLVSSTIVISAAHCFWNRARNQLSPASSFAVAVAKYFREWNHEQDIDAQKFDVMDIKIPARYQDGYTNFQDDVAIVLLAAPAVFNPFVRPVCLDMDAEFDANQLREGNYGKVAGWGVEDLEGSPSPVLKVIELPYVGIERCINEAPASFRPFITSDKICAGYTNGSAVCQGDSGGGLVFSAIVHVTNRYFLRGVVSTAPESLYACNAFDRTTFTKLTKHRDFVEKNTILFDQSTVSQLEGIKDTTLLDERLDTTQQGNANLCVLPPYPENGKYIVVGSPGGKPGQIVEFAQLNITCSDGYALDKSKAPSCSYGRWSEEFPNCIPECGRVVLNPPRSKRAVGGKTAGRGEMPWNVGVYTKTSNPYRQICGGTIIRNTLILSAARCFWSSLNSLKLPEKDFAVAAGKIFRQWTTPLDLDAQKSDINVIMIPKEFRGKVTNFEDDISLLKLTTPFSYNDFVRPICLDFNMDFWAKHLAEDANMGKIAGWGTTGENRATLRELTVVKLPYIDKDECLKISPPIFRRFITSDKICAGYINGTRGLCDGDTGAGLVFNEPDGVNNQDRYYLRGIASATQKEGRICNIRTFTAFTDIIKHQDFINPPLCILPQYPQNGKYTVIGSPDSRPGESLSSAQLTITCNKGFELGVKVSPSCSNGVWTHEIPECIVEVECGRVLQNPSKTKRAVGGTTVHRGEMPWNTGVFTKTSNPYRQICGGSIIRNFLVISAARCFWSNLNTVLLSEKDFAVAVGILYRQWNSAEDVDAQTSDISEISIPTGFRGKQNNFDSDIALLNLVTPIQFNDFIRPVCLNFDVNFWRNIFSENKFGKVAGWGTTGRDRAPSPALNQVKLPYINIYECKNISPPEFIQYLTNDKICAGYVNGTRSLCYGDVGAGLVYSEPDQNEDRFYLRGVASAIHKNGKVCDTRVFTAFTDIIRHENFIKAFPGF